MIMKLTVYNNAMYDDIEMALVRDDTGEVIMSGDDYHDKISHKIQGFITALHYQELINYDHYEYILTDIDSGDEMFDTLRFYNPEGEY